MKPTWPPNIAQAWAPDFGTSRLSEQFHLDPVSYIAELGQEILASTPGNSGHAWSAR
ncbi:MAG: hypothetical protein ABIK08_13315 [Pseudomonadota bacterium]